MKKLVLLFIPIFVCACSSSDSDVLYDKCVKTGMKEQMVGMEENDRYSVKVGVEQACKQLLKECKENPNGEWCAAFKSKFIN